MLAIIIAVGVFPAQLVDVIHQGIVPLASKFS